MLVQYAQRHWAILTIARNMDRRIYAKSALLLLPDAGFRPRTCAKLHFVRRQQACIGSSGSRAILCSPLRTCLSKRNEAQGFGAGDTNLRLNTSSHTTSLVSVMEVDACRRASDSTWPLGTDSGECSAFRSSGVLCGSIFGRHKLLRLCHPWDRVQRREADESVPVTDPGQGCWRCRMYS